MTVIAMTREIGSRGMEVAAGVAARLGLKIVRSETIANGVAERLCVQRKLACSAGGRPAGARVRSPVVRIAGWWETKILKPIDAVSFGEITSHRAVTTVNVDVASKVNGSGVQPHRTLRRKMWSRYSTIELCSKPVPRGGMRVSA
jgi:hypothetical protein